MSVEGEGRIGARAKAVSLLIALCLLSTCLAGCGSPDELPAEEIEETEPTLPRGISTANPQDALPSPLCPGLQPSFVTDLKVRKPPSLTEPPARSPFRDETFGTCLVRVTDREADLSPDDPSRGLKNEYSRVQSFNADGSYVLVRSIEQYWYLYDTASLQPLGPLPVETEPRWDAQDPSVIYHSDESRLMSYNVETGQATVVHDFADDLRQSLAAVWTRYEGRPSMDSLHWGLMAEDEDWQPVAFVVYDRLSDQVTFRDTRGMPGIEDGVDHVTISPLGTYFLASFDRACEHGELGDDAHPCGLMVYESDLTNGRSLLRIVGHYDTALDQQGREVILYQDIDTDHISMLDLESGVITPLLEIDFGHTPIGQHYSGLAYQEVGWGLVSTYSGGYPDAYTWMDDSVFAVELKAGGRVVRLAHTHSLVNDDMEHDYWAEPQASVNQDFTRILFTSNWGRSGTEEVEMVLIELPPEWTKSLP